MIEKFTNRDLNRLFMWKLRHFPKFLDAQRIKYGARFGSKLLSCLTMHGELEARVFRQGRDRVYVDNLGLLSCRVVTDAGVAFLATAFANTVEPEVINFHDAGTGTTAESAAQTTLVTPWGGARVSGTQTNPASGQYRSTATITFNSTFAITEHGIFSASSAGTMWDRSLFSAINVVNTDSIQFQYTLTINSGG